MQQLNKFDVLYPNFKFGKKIRVFETFAGIGAQKKALKRLSQKYNIDIESVGISEIDKYAIQSYMAVHGEIKNYGDIAKINGKDLPQIDLFTYSFPCQDISIAGHQEGFAKGSGTRSGLLWEVELILKEIEHKPKVLLMENVKNLISERFMDDFVGWQHELEHMGYMNYWQVLNAKDYGIPQNRERVFMISILGEYNYNFPQPFPLELRLKDMLEDEVDEKYYLDSEKIKRIVDLNKIVNKEISNTIRVGGRGSLDRHQWDLVADNVGIRQLTPKECWRLMGFDDEDFEKAKKSGVSDTQLYKQAGNSIVVDVLEHIFEIMIGDKMKDQEINGIKI